MFVMVIVKICLAYFEVRVNNSSDPIEGLKAIKQERQFMHHLMFSPMLASGMLLAHSAAVIIVVLTILAIIRSR